jgi:hypothetical protein
MSGAPATTQHTTWVLGGFVDSDKMMDAGRKLRDLKYTDLDTYSPYPLHGVDEALGLSKSNVPKVVLGGGLTGATIGFTMQWFLNAVDFPLNIGGRPLFSWPQWIPVTFELAILLGSFGAFLSVFAFSGLPRPHHPVFEVEGFRRASIDRFWLSVALKPATTEDRERITKLLEEAGAEQVSVVEDVET